MRAEPDKAELIVRRGVEDQGGKRSAACGLIVQIGAGRRLQSVVRAIAVHAEVICRTIIVVAKTQLVVCGVEIAVAGNQFALA